MTLKFKRFWGDIWSKKKEHKGAELKQTIICPKQAELDVSVGAMKKNSKKSGRLEGSGTRRGSRPCAKETLRWKA